MQKIPNTISGRIESHSLQFEIILCLVLFSYFIIEFIIQVGDYDGFDHFQEEIGVTYFEKKNEIFFDHFEFVVVELRRQLGQLGLRDLLEQVVDGFRRVIWKIFFLVFLFTLVNLLITNNNLMSFFPFPRFKDRLKKNYSNLNFLFSPESTMSLSASPSTRSQISL